MFFLDQVLPQYNAYCVHVCRPEILKQEIKVFFVKYNDPIYVKLEKLDIMIRLASQANIAQVPLPSILLIDGPAEMYNVSGSNSC